MSSATQIPASDSTPHKRLGELAVERGLLTASQLQEALENQARLREMGLSERIGTIFSKKKLLSPEAVQELLREQSGGVRRLGNFEIGEKIGQGAMGVVFKARQISMDRTVALKILAPKYANDPLFIERFVKEARAAGQFNHEHIVNALDVGYVAPYHYFAMEHVEGMTLGRMLKDRGALPEREALTYILQVSQALGHALGKKIIHRDVKPENIMITPAGGAKLLDLGLACVAGAGAPEEGAQEAAPEAERKAVGTPHYMSPEAARGEEDLDTRADIYSLGCTLYHLLCNHTPFEGNRSRMIMALHLTEEVPDVRKRNPRISGWTARIVGRMTEKERADRYADPSELIEDLNQVLAGKPPLHAKPDASERSSWKNAATTGPRAPIGARGTTGPRAPISPRSTTGPAAPILGDRTGALEPAGFAGTGEIARSPARSQVAKGPGLWIAAAAAVLVAIGIGLSLSGGSAVSTGSTTARTEGGHDAAGAGTSTSTNFSASTTNEGNGKIETGRGKQAANREERARAALEDVLQLERRRPDEHSLLLAAWERVREQARDTSVAAQAGEASKAAQARWSKALDEVLQEKRAQTDAAIGKEDYAGAWAALESGALPAQVKAGDWEARLGVLRAPVREAAEAAAAKLLAEARTKAGTQSEAGWEAALELARKAEDIPGTLSPSAALAARERAKWSGALEAWRKAQAAERRARQLRIEALVASVRKEVSQLIRQQKLTAARELVERKWAEGLEPDARDALALEKSDLEALWSLRVAAVEGLKKQAGKTVSLQKGSSLLTGELQGAGPELGITLKLAGGAEVSLGAEQLSASDVDQHATEAAGVAEAEGLKRRGLLWLYAGELSKAKEQFEKARAAGLGEAAGGYLERIEALEVGEVEMRARQEWQKAEGLFKEKKWKEAQLAFHAFKAEHGKSKIAEAHADLLQERLEALEAILSPFKPGLVASFYKGQDFKERASDDEEKALLQRVDALVDFKWGKAAPARNVPTDQFCIRWSGSIKVEKAGKYSFSALADDGARLWIGGKLAWDAWLPGKRNPPPEFELEPGMHELKLEYAERGGNAECHLRWRLKDGFKDQLVPADVLWHDMRKSPK